jgi:hypothetical protein
MQERAIKNLHAPAPCSARLFKARLAVLSRHKPRKLRRARFRTLFKLFKMFKSPIRGWVLNILNILNNTALMSAAGAQLG